MSTWIGTHNGQFHCDEVFACYMLKKLHKFATHTVVRTRDPSILEKCDIVVDVGGVYDHGARRYDHHQRGFTDTMKTVTGLDFETKLSSAGLIYAHYGKSVIARLIGVTDENDRNVKKLYEYLYKTFVESVDAIDNGIQQFDGPPRYMLASTLTSRVQHCNPAWNEREPNAEKGFQRAMDILRDEFEERVAYLHKSWLPARNLVVAAIERRKEVHPSGRILLFDTQCPWKGHFFELENEIGIADEHICLAVYADETNSSWRVQAIPVSETSGFENRILLPWKGLRDADLARESGIEGAIFVHISGFIGGAKTKEGAMQMAERTLAQEEQEQKKKGEENGTDEPPKKGQQDVQQTTTAN